MALSINDEEVASKKTNSIQDLSAQTIPNFRPEMVKMDTLFQTKTAKKPYPLRPHIPT